MVKIDEKNAKASNKLGCSIYNEDDGVVEMWSPKGSVFKESGCHCCCIPYEDAHHVSRKTKDGVAHFHRNASSREINAAIREIFGKGFEPCDNPDCEHCSEPDY